MNRLYYRRTLRLDRNPRLILCVQLGQRWLRPSGGFTLIEVMVVVVIIGLLAAIVAPNLLGNIDRARVPRASLDIRNIEVALNFYRLDNFRYPTTDQGLDTLVTNPGESVAPNWKAYLDSVSSDP